MRHRRGRFLTSLEESIVIRREKPQRRQGEAAFLFPVGESPVSAIILPIRETAALSDIIAEDSQFACNLTPPYPDIRIGDEVVRHSGSSDESVLTVKQVEILLQVQRLHLGLKTIV